MHIHSKREANQQKAESKYKIKYDRPIITAIHVISLLG